MATALVPPKPNELIWKSLVLLHHKDLYLSLTQARRMPHSGQTMGFVGNFPISLRSSYKVNMAYLQVHSLCIDELVERIKSGNRRDDALFED